MFISVKNKQGQHIKLNVNKIIWYGEAESLGKSIVVDIGEGRALHLEDSLEVFDRKIKRAIKG